MKPGPLQNALRGAVIRVGLGGELPDSGLLLRPRAQCPDGFRHVTLFFKGLFQPVADLYPSVGIRRPFEKFCSKRILKFYAFTIFPVQS